MTRSEVQKIQEKLEERLTEKQKLASLGWGRPEVLRRLKAPGFRQALKNFDADSAHLCAGVLAVCRPAMDAFSPEPEEGWLPALCRHGKHVLYPENFPAVLDPSQEKAALFYGEVLRAVLEWEPEARGFSPSLHFRLPEEAEARRTDHPVEYRRFVRVCRRDWVFEFMRLASEVTPFHTLGHIAGVHHIAMHVARQLDSVGVPIDLALVSAAAIGHDIGKFGCKEKEGRRVPYLHYYYTDLYFNRNQMPTIGHIAANHSTWDLELENLSVESLVLIYADFRSKSVRGEDGRERPVFYTLKDAFDVILNKLDHVDAAKRERYQRVYDKLADFEVYMEEQGVHTDLDHSQAEPRPRTDTALLHGEQLVRAYKSYAIRHNIRLMHILNVEKTFYSILETARSGRDWKNIRSHLNVFQEYYTYMTPKQKLLTIRLLYELLMHSEGDIRSQAARLMGQLIVSYDTEYRKEIPEGWAAFYQDGSSLGLFRQYFQMGRVPDNKLTEQHRQWMMYRIEDLTESAIQSAKKGQKRAYLEVALDAYRDTDRDDFTAFTMVNAIQKLPFSLCTEEDFRVLFGFVEHFAGRDRRDLQVAVLQLVLFCLKQKEAGPLVRGFCQRLFRQIPDRPAPSIQFLRWRIGHLLELERREMVLLEEFSFQKHLIANLFLENLKTATPWICKEIHIECLSYLMQAGRNNQPMHTATHLANLLTVNDCDDVRHCAGRALVKMAEYISQDQCNEVVVELFQGLETGGSQFAKDVPIYLAELILHLGPDEVEEHLLTLERMVNQNQESVACAALDTLGHLIQRAPDYRERAHETSREYGNRMGRFLGLLLRGMANYHDRVSQEAVYVLGEFLFGSDRLPEEEKSWIFRHWAKKILHVLADQPEPLLSFLIRAASLNHLYRFLSDYLFRNGEFQMEECQKAAFFPGTFDPFSLSHKGIVQEIRKLGYQVYLAMDEFSWSKKTQPKGICRKIAAMSVADDAGVFLFPDSKPINIANEEDLKRLKDLFPGKELAIVVGSDVIANASAYRKPPCENSIHHFDHIVFRRNMGGQIPESYPNMLGTVQMLSLPVYLEDISSTRIRESIDENRDISQLIDPVAQSYIYENSLYLREPQDKPILRARQMHLEILEKETDAFLESLPAEQRRKSRPGQMAAVLWDDSGEKAPLAFCLFRHLPMREVGEEFGNPELSNRIRNFAGGKIFLLSQIQVMAEDRYPRLRQWILTETLAYALEQEYTYCLYHGSREDEASAELLRLQGFLRMDAGEGELVMAAALYAPTTLTDNVESVLKEPFQSNPRVQRMLRRAHRRLQEAACALRPGHLVLSFDSYVMYHQIIEKITEINGVPKTVAEPKILGEKMCVPFGKMFRDSAAPNTVTKALHTERVFREDMSGFTIEEYPNYSPLRTQMRTIRSFRRDVILVDDLLHKGYRLKALMPLLASTPLSIDCILVGILSARGRELAERNGLQAQCVYFIPNIHTWIVESTMYPFIGGDSVKTTRGGFPGLLPSVNLILPYVAPVFLMRDSKQAAYQVSMTCLENARDILRVLEEEYQHAFGRTLTLNRLGQAILSPTCPDKGNFMRYDGNLPASTYVENDIRQLIRMRNLNWEEEKT